MKYLPHMIGAVAIAAVAGAVSGQAIGDTEVLRAASQDTLPDAQPFATGSQPRTDRRPPDQYPLKTPDGTIAVSELALHGRLRDSAQAYWQRRGAQGAELSASYAIDFDEEALVRLAREEALIAYTSQPRAVAPVAAQPIEEPQRQTRAEAPMALAEPEPRAAPQSRVALEPRPAQSIGRAKTVDVAAALQAQGS